MASGDFATDNLHVSDPSGHIDLTLDLDGGCRVGSLTVDGVEVLAGSGVRTGVRTRGGAYTSGAVKSAPCVSRRGDVLTVDSIVYGDGALAYIESWRFEPCGDAIVWTITSNTGTALARVEDRFVPQWDFAAMDTWKGGILDNGGMVWCKYLRAEDDTCGVHTGGITLWNPDRSGALRIETSAGGVMHQKFSHGKNGVFTIKHIPASGPLQMRYDLSRCVGGREDVFAPYIVEGGDTVTVRLSYVDYQKRLHGIGRRLCRPGGGHAACGPTVTSDCAVRPIGRCWAVWPAPSPHMRPHARGRWTPAYWRAPPGHCS